MIVVVTGASAGVGRATALEFAARGYNVAILARNQARLETAADEIRRKGVKALPIVADVADFAAVDAAAGQVERQLGPIDVWVNNAMTTVFAPVEKITPEEVKHATEVTYLGQVDRDDGGAVADAAAKSGHHCQCWLRARVSGDPAAISVLRRQIRGSRVYLIHCVASCSSTIAPSSLSWCICRGSIVRHQRL